MRILIISDQNIEAGKLRLFFSRYGQCDIAPGGKAGVEMYKKAYDAGNPYKFVNVEMDMADIKGIQAADAIRRWEVDNTVKPVSRILLILSEVDGNRLGAALESRKINSLIKPYDRKKLETVVAELNLEKETATPSAAAKEIQRQQAQLSPEEIARRALEEKRIQAILQKISQLVTDEEKFQGIEPRQMVEELVKEGGKQAELLFSQFITSPKLPMTTRMELVRSAGYLKSPLFLVPLNRVVEAEENIRIVEVALVSISRYNDQRALALLNNALKKIKNPMLLSTLRRQIARIKEDKPVLAILPRFLQSHKNPKNLRISLDILKKIVTPEDSGLFLNYMKSGNEIIEDATFELLCNTADNTIKTQLFNFFEDRIQRIPCLKEKECYDLYIMMIHMCSYYFRFPELIDEQLNELKDIYALIPDIRARQLIASVMCRSQLSDALLFIKKIYTEEEQLKESIIENLSGNRKAVDFLFEKYHSGQELQEKVVRSLLQSDEGLQYFIKNYFTFDIDKQEMIIRNLTFSTSPFLVAFIRKVFESSLYSVKVYLMGILREHFMFMFRDTLFHPDNQREFMFMGSEYYNTIVHLFPIKTIKYFLRKIAFEDISTTKIKKFLAYVQMINALEPVLDFSDPRLVNGLFSRIFKINNAELNTHFFNSLENIKALDYKSFKYLIEAANTFGNERGAAISENEKGAIQKLKQRLRDEFSDMSEMEQFHKELQQIFMNSPIELESLDKLIRSNHMAAALNIERLSRYLAGRLKAAEFFTDDDRQSFFMRFPIITRFIEHLWKQGFNTRQEWDQITLTGDLWKNCTEDLRIILSFKNRRLSALLRDQLEEVFPQFQVLTDQEKLTDHDIFVCDTDVLKEYSRTQSMTNRKIYLYLEHRADFAQYRDLNPKAFMKPISGHRLVKMILKELYLHK